MIFGVIVGMSLLSFCLGESSKQAVSSINFRREDIPVSYQYSSVHSYDTRKTKKQSNSNLNNDQHPELYKNIQYAPLILTNKEQEINDDHYTKTSVTPNDSNQSNVPDSDIALNKYNLEPHVFEHDRENSNYKEHPVHFVAGYNINGKPKIDTHHSDLGSGRRNIYPFQNSNNYFLGRIPEEPFKDLPIQEQDKETTFRAQQTVTEPDELKPKRPYSLNHEQCVEIPKQSIRMLPALENIQIQPINNQYVKMPRVHLNVARSHKIATAQRKAPINENRNIRVGKSNQQFISKFETILAQNTFLYPAKDKKFIIKHSF